MEQYLNSVRYILKNGVPKTDPQKVGNIACFALMERYNLTEGFPLITTRSLKGSWKAIVVELLWYLSGDTRVDFMHKYGVHTWDQWATPEVCGQVGLETGNLGPTYPKQWTRFGRDEINQVQRVIEVLKSNPDSRRGVVTAWNPEDIDKVFIAPCHDGFNFFHAGGKLSLLLKQRSCDYPIGKPFNVAQYALLLMMVAQVTGLEPHEFVHVTVDSHIYIDQIDAMRELIKREPRPLPHVRINPDVTDIFSFHPDDFELMNYNPYPPLKIPVSL